MAEKKKNAGTEKKTRSAKPAEPKPEKLQKEIPAAPPPPRRYAGSNQIYSVILFAAAILILLLALVQGSSGWLMLHKAFKGFFGLPLLIIPPALCYLAVMIDKDETPQKLIQSSMNVLLVTTFLSGFIEIMFGGGRLQEATFKDSMQMLYEEGVNWSGGGMVSIVAMPLQKLLGDVGSKITICLLLFVSIMIMSRKGVSDIFDFVSAPFRRMKELYEDEQENAGLLDDFETEVEEERIREERALAEQAEEAEALDLVKKPRSRKSKKTQEPQFLSDLSGSIDVPMADPAALALDIPLYDTSALREPDPNMVITDYTDMTDPAPLSEPMPDPADEDLEALIRQATEKPEKGDKLKKKTKEEEKLDAMQEIADEVALRQAGSTPEHPYQMPSMDFLKKGKSHANDPGAAQELREKADLLQQVMESFNVEARITNIARGPSVTRYEVQPAAGVKVSKIAALHNDLALNLRAKSLRIEAPIPGKAAVGIEVSNDSIATVTLREIIESETFKKSKSKISVAIGRNVGGDAIVADLKSMPHLLVAGSTGSGKSVCINSMIISLLYKAAPEEVKLILIDPKVVELSIYNGIPHLLIPVVTDSGKAAAALGWAVSEMNERYNKFAAEGVRDLQSYNETVKANGEDDKVMPQIVIIIDELAELIMTAKNTVEDSICRIAQKARAAGMHLIVATQRPSTDVITGVIKANIPSRIAFAVSSLTDSRVILDVGGAEHLLGKGDMLYGPQSISKPMRVQGCFVSDDEVRNVINFVKEQVQMANYNTDVLQAMNRAGSQQGSADSEESDEDELLTDAIETVVKAEQCSVSMLQRRFRIGYNRAARLVDLMEERGIVGPADGARPRKVNMSQAEFQRLQDQANGISNLSVEEEIH